MELKKMEDYSIRENSRTINGLLAGTITVDFMGLTPEKKISLDKYILECINWSKSAKFQEGPLNEQKTVSRKPVKIFTKWQVNYLRAVPGGIDPAEVARIFRKRFKKSVIATDAQIIKEYIRMKGDAVVEKPKSSPASVPNEPKVVIPDFSVGDKVKYRKANPRFPTPIGVVAEAPTGKKILVEFGPTDKKWVFKEDYEIVSKVKADES